MPKYCNTAGDIERCSVEVVHILENIKYSDKEGCIFPCYQGCKHVTVFTCFIFSMKCLSFFFFLLFCFDLEFGQSQDDCHIFHDDSCRDLSRVFRVTLWCYDWVKQSIV